jgi:PRTRC genetic system protein E
LRRRADAVVGAAVQGTLTETEDEAMLKEIVMAMSAGDRIQFELARTTQGVRVTVTPLLGDDPEKVPAAAAGTRAALALPLVVTGATVEAVQEALAERYAGYAMARSGLQSSYSALLDTLREASKEAAGKAKGATVAPKTAAKAAAVKSEADADDEETDDGPSDGVAATDEPAPQAGNALTLEF